MAKAKAVTDTDIEQAIENRIKTKFRGWDKKGKASGGGGSGMLYFVGFIGSLVYWMQAAAGFGAVVTGFLKAGVWPAYIAYKLFEMFYGVVS